MKHIFLINPAAGVQDASECIRREIADAMRGTDYEVRVTEAPGHATRLVRELAQAYAPEICRFYACGGDGTLSETADGAVGVENAEIACLPYGTGNDFIKIFENTERFRSIEAQRDGDAMELDAMQVGDRCAINLCNAGIDARICDWVVRNKRRYRLPGAILYKLSVLLHFFRRINRKYHIEIDGKPMDEEVALVVAANGSWYGGGFHAVPVSEPDDGLLNVVGIRRVSRWRFLRSVGDYAEGRHDRLGELEICAKARQLTLESEEPEPVCMDGEIVMTRRVDIRVLPRALRFVVPKGANLIRPGGERVTA